jgi:YaiO family outer membrane protein
LYIKNIKGLIFSKILLGILIFFCPLAHLAQERINEDDLFKHAKDIGIAGKRVEARQICQQILKQNPDHHDARVLLGRLYAWDGEYEQARREFSTVLMARPNYIEAREAMIDVELWSSNPQEALRLSEEGLESESKNSRLLYKKARSLEMLKRMREAKEVIAKALALDPASTEARALLRRVEAQDQSYRLRADYIYDTFNETFSDWHLGSINLTRALPFGSIGGRLNIAQRFDKTAAQFEVDAYPNFRKGSYAYLNVGVSSSEVIFPKFRFGGEYYHNLPSGFEASAGIRHLRFKSSDVTVFTGSVGKYYKNYWVSLRPYFSPSSTGSSVSGYFTIRRYFAEAENYLTVTVGSGSSPDGKPTTLETYRFETRSINVDFRKRIHQGLYSVAYFGFENQEVSSGNCRNRFTAGIGVEKRF